MKYVNKTTGAIMESNCSCFGGDWKLVDDVDVTDKTNEELDTAEETESEETESEETESEDAEEFEKNKDPKKGDSK
mgnify:CR=1 FL=1